MGSLILLLICLLLLIIVIFVLILLLYPVKYQGHVDIDNKSGWFRVEWLFRLIRFRLMIEDGMEAILNIAFKKIDFTDPEEKRKRAEKKRKKLAKKRAKAIRKREKERKKWMRKRGKISQEADISASELNESNVEEHVQDGNKEQKSSKLDGIRSKLPMIKKIWSSIQQTDLMYVLMPKIMKLLQHLFPKQIRGKIEFGLEDPSTTGKIVGVIAMIPFLYETELMIYPEFECDEKYIKGQVDLKGKIRVIHLLVFVVSCMKEKQVRRFIKLIRKKDKTTKKA